ncbi:MAG: DUF1294 domain-containing protein [Candidatus Onthomonas sp.]
MSALSAFLPHWLVLINVLAFVLFGLDKWKARRDAWRISENALMLSAVLGGSIGALAGMRVFHHKTRHKKFFIGIPLLLALDVALAILGRILGWW